MQFRQLVDKCVLEYKYYDTCSQQSETILASTTPTAPRQKSVRKTWVARISSTCNFEDELQYSVAIQGNWYAVLDHSERNNQQNEHYFLLHDVVRNAVLILRAQEKDIYHTSIR